MFNKVKVKKYLIGMFAAIILMSAVLQRQVSLVPATEERHEHAH